MPCGTVLRRNDERGEVALFGELVEDGQRLLVAEGGKGGRGNAAFVTATMQAPYIGEQGGHGEERWYRLELQLIADVGIVGKPNAGKSTLLQAASNAVPKIADYPFTTTEPVLGMVEVGWERFLVVEIPGLMEGAHRGVGLGLGFLRHASRTRLLLHLVDGSAEDPRQAVRQVDDELRAYGSGLQEKPQIVAVNKLDLPEVQARRKAIARALTSRGHSPYFISAATGQGVPELLGAVASMLEEVPKKRASEAVRAPVAAGQGSGIVVTREESREGPCFVVRDAKAEHLVAGSDLRMWAGRVQLKGQLNRLGVTLALEEAGVNEGDTVRFGEIELEW